MMKSEKRKDYTLEIRGPEGGDILLVITGRIVLSNLHQVTDDLRTIPAEVAPSSLTVDLTGLDYLDSSGALALLHLKHEAEARSVPFEFIGMNSRVKGIMDLLHTVTVGAASAAPERKQAGLIEQVGEAGMKVAQDFVTLMSFTGALVTTLLYSAAHPRSVRWDDVLHNMKQVGVDGFPIVTLISVLLGLIMAFMSSLQLKQFGANIYVASLVSIAMVKELGPIMTAILVAGRSGSAFAAEIGTMVVNDEVNALVTMGFDPLRFLVVPRIIAAAVVVPLLTLYADAFAILGSLVVGVLGLDLTVYTYMQQIRITIDNYDVMTGFIKSLFFAFLVGGIGCHRGFQVRGGPESVGRATTSAVVSAIFLIILADSIFAIVLHYLERK